MIISTNVNKIIDWLDNKCFNYDIDIFRSNPLHGQYYVSFKNINEELMTRLRWGIM
jgi:hypothetical protein